MQIVKDEMGAFKLKVLSFDAVVCLNFVKLTTTTKIVSIFSYFVTFYFVTPTISFLFLSFSEFGSLFANFFPYILQTFISQTQSFRYLACFGAVYTRIYYFIHNDSLGGHFAFQCSIYFFYFIFVLFCMCVFVSI